MYLELWFTSKARMQRCKFPIHSLVHNTLYSYPHFKYLRHKKTVWTDHVRNCAKFWEFPFILTFCSKHTMCIAVSLHVFHIWMKAIGSWINKQVPVLGNACTIKTLAQTHNNSNRLIWYLVISIISKNHCRIHHWARS